MEKITFKKLHDLVANVTDIFVDTYPISFSVNNGNNTLHYEVGIGEWCESEDYEWNNMVNYLYPYPMKVQYLSLCCSDNPNDVFSFLDAQDSEDMVYDEIGKMLKKKCNITDNSEIYLDEENSFNGLERTIDEEETSQMLRDDMVKTYEMNNNNANDKNVKENTPTLYKCETDIETYIIPTKNIITMKPIHSQDGEPYIKVEYYDDELCINNTIFCTEVNSYRPTAMPISKLE